MEDVFLNDNEYTDHKFLAFLKKKLKQKSNVHGREFTMNDVNQYCKKGQLPNTYGGALLEITTVFEKVRIIKVIGEVKHVPKKTKKNGKAKV